MIRYANRDVRGRVPLGACLLTWFAGCLAVPRKRVKGVSFFVASNQSQNIRSRVKMMMKQIIMGAIIGVIISVVVDCLKKKYPIYGKKVSKCVYIAWALYMAFIGLFILDYYTTPPLPVDVRFRQALMDKGYVGMFINKSNKPFACKLVLRNSSLNQKTVMLLEIAPKKTTEIGWMEGWSFASGETFEVHCDGYRTMYYSVP
jgi:hypothetical protein